MCYKSANASGLRTAKITARKFLIHLRDLCFYKQACTLSRTLRCCADASHNVEFSAHGAWGTLAPRHFWVAGHEGVNCAQSCRLTDAMRRCFDRTVLFLRSALLRMLSCRSRTLPNATLLRPGCCDVGAKVKGTHAGPMMLWQRSSAPAKGFDSGSFVK